MRALVVLILVLVLAPLASGADAAQKLYVTFLVNGTFRVTLPDGTPVGGSSAPGTTITPGTYELVFDNSQNIKNLNFQLVGPNVSLQESMGGGEVTSDSEYATFLPSSQYRWFDGNNINSAPVYVQTAAGGGSVGANGSGLPGSNTQTAGSGSNNATVVGSKNGSSSSGILAGGGSTPARLRGALVGTVAANRALSLKLGGKAVTSLKQGRYTVTLSDQSPTNGFTIQQAKQGATTVTAVPFVGKRTATATLRPGQWLHYPTFVGRKSYFLVTS